MLLAMVLHMRNCRVENSAEVRGENCEAIIEISAWWVVWVAMTGWEARDGRWCGRRVRCRRQYGRGKLECLLKVRKN